MAYKDPVRDLGNNVAFAANNKGTARRGVPTAIAEISKTETAAPVENPVKLSTTGNSVRALRDLGTGKKISTKV
jgi:hypothetical protein